MAPKIPDSKEAMIRSLQLVPEAVDEAQSLGLTHSALSKTELKVLFKKWVKGTFHPKDPVRGMDRLTRQALQQRLLEHSVPVLPSSNKGALMMSLRVHWQEQCSLAVHEKMNVHKTTGGNWELVDPMSGGAFSTLNDFIQVQEGMQSSVATMIEEYSKQDNLKPLVENIRETYEKLLGATSALLSAIDQ